MIEKKQILITGDKTRYRKISAGNFPTWSEQAGGGSATVDPDSVDTALESFTTVTTITDDEKIVIKGKKLISLGSIKTMLQSAWANVFAAKDHNHDGIYDIAGTASGLVETEAYNRQHADNLKMDTSEFVGAGATKTVQKALSATNDHSGNDIEVTYATKIALADKVDKVAGKGLSPEEFTLTEKQKLAALDGNHWKGKFTTYELLEAAWPTANDGDSAAVDAGVGEDIASYLWDSSDNKWVIQKGSSTAETAASVKSKLESNPDTNTLTDSLLNKLLAFTANFTSELKTSYDSSVTWITSHGADVVAHLVDSTIHVTSGMKTAWNAKWDSTSHPTTVSGYGITDIPTNADTVDGFHVWSGSQAAYDAIVTKSSTTIYIIV